MNTMGTQLVYSCSDPNIAYKKFISPYKSIYNKYFPLKKISFKKAKLISKPWGY